jgi:hypothetical protein
VGCKKHVQTGGKVDDEYPSDIHSATCAMKLALWVEAFPVGGETLRRHDDSMKSPGKTQSDQKEELKNYLVHCQVVQGG